MHRALLLASVVNGPCELRGLLMAVTNLGMPARAGGAGSALRRRPKGHAARARRRPARAHGAQGKPITAGTRRRLRGYSPACSPGSLSGPSCTVALATRGAACAPSRSRSCAAARKISGAPHPDDAKQSCACPSKWARSRKSVLEAIDYVMSRPNDHAKGALLFSGLSPLVPR